MKQKQQQKLWEKQERKLREMKSKGVSKENAEKAQLKAKAREPGVWQTVDSISTEECRHVTVLQYMIILNSAPHTTGLPLLIFYFCFFSSPLMLIIFYVLLSYSSSSLSSTRCEGEEG